MTPAFAADSEVSLTTASGVLWGSLLAPQKGAGIPAALIISGSGPTDRNGNGLTIHPDTYKLLAEAFAQYGITTLRTDKRGIGQSASATASESDLRVQTYASDTKAWAAYLRERTGAPCIWLIGHSEGALIAEIAAQDANGICGLVLISAPGRKLGAIIRSQLDANPNNPADLKQTAGDILSKLEAGKTVSDVPQLLAGLFRPSVQPYLISEINLDPAALLTRVKLPVLVLQGDNDLQVSVEDAKLLAAAKQDAKLVILPGVNHVLKDVPKDRAANIASYGNPQLPVAPGVVDNVVAFLK